MSVLAFDRDWTVDVNPHPRREAVPLEWVRYWAHNTDHEDEWWPDRAERLHILARLFPDADAYIVVDDLDLSYVDGWTDCHAWDFLDAIDEGHLDLTIPREP